MRRSLAVLCSAVVVSSTLVACSSSSSSSGSAQGVTSKQITIGTSMGLTGPTAAEAQAALHGAEAYFDYVNANGGVNGRKISIKALDDGFKTSQTLTNVRQLVDQDKVFSLFYVWGLNNTLAVLPFVKQSKIPLVGPQAPTSKVVDPTLPNVYLMEPTFSDEGAICANTLNSNSAVSKLGILYSNDAIGQDGLNGFTAAAAKGSKTVVSKVAYTSGSPSFTGQIVQLKKAGVTGLAIFGANPDIVNIAKGISANGWKPTVCASSNVFDPTFLKISGQYLNDLTGSLGQDLPESTDAAVATYRSRLKQYFPSDSPTLFGVQAYGEAMLLVQALKQAGKKLTWSSLENALDSFKNVQTGVLFPVSFSKADHDGITQYRTVAVQNGQPQFTSALQTFKSS